ncbi:MAG: hypothetical protein LAO78_09470 [Acidobacteriia bacterium]|nr:hypothetical protein [Terriglobia bacterium]
MLAQRRVLRYGGQEIERTPLLVPSFSSRVPEIDKILKASEEFLDGPLLVSAYDIYHQKITPPFDFGSIVIFLDSGGYEVSRQLDLSEVEDQTDAGRRGWSEEFHSEILTTWKSRLPTVVVSYDHPNERHPLTEQIKRASRLAEGRTDILRELLIKPETPNQKYIQFESVLKAVRDFDIFDAIGLTEKEIGNSILMRMENIARLRVALTKAGLETPIHIFGSLDTVTTLFYFIAGADIFDGLTWLRYAYSDGLTLYRQNFGVLEYGFSMKTAAVEALCWAANHSYLKDLQLEMRRFLKAADFSVFEHHRTELQAAFRSISESLGV